MPAQAFFGPPVPEPVPKGLRLGLTLIPVRRGRLWMCYRPEGLFGGPKEAWYFPTDYFQYGEPLKDAVRRVLREQAGFDVWSYFVMDAWSSIAKTNSNWDFGIVVEVEVKGRPHRGPGVRWVQPFELQRPWGRRVAWFTPEDIRSILGNPVHKVLRMINQEIIG
jgi:ADP-ribose pyrophosphatase YjhB (NUDIX family)